MTVGYTYGYPLGFYGPYYGPRFGVGVRVGNRYPVRRARTERVEQRALKRYVYPAAVRAEPNQRSP